MKKNAFFVLGIAALALVFGLALAGCPTGMTGITVAVTGTDPAAPALPGNVTIQPGSATIGTLLTAYYDGDETVTWQWKNNVAPIEGETGATYTPATTGYYAVTASAEGYNSKTSAYVYVTAPFYTVTFDANDGGDGSSVTGLPDPITDVASGATVTQPAANPGRTGYVFGGWYKEAAATTAWNFGTDTVTGNVTLYALWRAAIADEDKYRFTGGEWYTSWNSYSGVAGAVSALGENTLTVSGGGVSISYTGVYMADEITCGSGTLAYLYDGSGKIGVAVWYSESNKYFFLGNTGTQEWIEERGIPETIELTDMQTAINGYGSAP